MLSRVIVGGRSRLVRMERVCLWPKKRVGVVEEGLVG